ncbi:nuclear transport factor 2 family protein [Aminobacter aganoensis]|uniref:Ketosteroid isomerase-like protein n=1 Tax=Aminobacter aganoensis TaxID=83264 RepID=A0A7X0KJF0_9HYPH|nr:MULTISPECIES: nuclear transport factor 2 family protein [Aminobacter]KQU65904.1 caspase [Aminobacter sp. DSM 101952]MBB6353146.1 ketosteroid isomerase-like protein [Aminobacter aganoensis]
MNELAFDPVAALKHYHAAIDDLDFEAIEACFAPDAEYVSDGVGAIVGRDAIMAAFRGYFAVYGDQVSKDETVAALSPRAAWSRWRLDASDAATGVRLSRSGVETVHFDANCRIAKVEVIDDAAAR